MTAPPGLPLQGRVALVTGGASGLGAATSSLFVEQGAWVVVADVNVERGQALADDLAGKGAGCIFQRVDVTDDGAVHDAIRAAEDVFGHLDTVVANAGIGGAASLQRLEEVAEEDWARIFDVNVSGVWRTFKHAVPALRRAGGGAMTSTGSLAGLTVLGGTHLGAYTATKFAVTGLTKFWAAELVDDGIRVNCVCPGRMDTNIVESFGLAGPQLDAAKQARRANALRAHEYFVGQPDDVASLHLFLCSDAARFVNGQALLADGGINLFGHHSWGGGGSASSARPREDVPE